MQTHLILSAIATDEPREFDSLVHAIHECGCSIREARLVHFGDHMGIIAGIAGNWNAIAKLEGVLARLDDEGGLQITSSRSDHRAAPAETVPYLAEIIGADRPGVLARVVRFFFDRGVVIEDLHATSYRAPHTETQMGSAHLTVGLPSSLSLATVRGEFMDLCDELNVDGMLAPVR